MHLYLPLRDQVSPFDGHTVKALQQRGWKVREGRGTGQRKGWRTEGRDRKGKEEGEGNERMEGRGKGGR